MTEMGDRIIFVLGGARSGKSDFALRDASARPGRKAYIATAQALDREMEERITKHREERSSEWRTFEEPIRLSSLIEEAGGSHEVVLVDCLTLWLSNLVLGEEKPDDRERTEKGLEQFLDALRRFQDHGRREAGTDSRVVYLVSNEVGMGIVPDNALSRRFRDLAGRLNRRVAEIADEAYLVVAGMPLKIK